MEAIKPKIEELIPFDYELYKQGNHEAVFRNHKNKVIHVRKNHTFSPQYIEVLSGWTDGADYEEEDLDYYYPDGRFSKEKETRWDLFLKLKQ